MIIVIIHNNIYLHNWIGYFYRNHALSHDSNLNSNWYILFFWSDKRETQNCFSFYGRKTPWSYKVPVVKFRSMLISYSQQHNYISTSLNNFRENMAYDMTRSVKHDFCSVIWSNKYVQANEKTRSPQLRH